MPDDTATKLSEELAALKAKDVERDAQFAAMKAETDALKAENARIATERENQAKTLRFTEAERWVEKHSSRENLRIFPKERAAMIALHQYLAEAPADKKLTFREGEKTEDVRPLDLLVRCIEARPDAKYLSETMTRAIDPDDHRLTFNEAMAAIAAEDKLDLDKPADRRVAALKTAQKYPELAPDYNFAKPTTH